MTDRAYIVSRTLEHKIAIAENNDQNTLIVTLDVLKEILALLKEQKPRVITLDELAEIYVEFKGDACPIRLSNFDLQKIIMYAGDGVCRLWTGKPTDEQRKAVKWDD